MTRFTLHVTSVLQKKLKIYIFKYEHRGLSLVNTRKLGEKSFMYDLVRENK